MPINNLPAIAASMRLLDMVPEQFVKKMLGEDVAAKPKPVKLPSLPNGGKA